MTKDDIIDKISFNKRTENEELFSVAKDCHIVMLKILFHFGFKDSMYKEPLLLMKDYIKLIKKEMDVFDYILINSDYLDCDKTYDLLKKIDILHNRAYYRLDKDLYDMIDAINISDPYRVRKSKYVDLAINYDDYLTEAYHLSKAK